MWRLVSQHAEGGGAGTCKPATQIISYTYIDKYSKNYIEIYFLVSVDQNSCRQTDKISLEISARNKEQQHTRKIS